MPIITDQLAKGQVVFLQAQEHDDALVKLVPVEDGITPFIAWVKFHKGQEYQVGRHETIVVDAILANEQVDQKAWDKL